MTDDSNGNAAEIMRISQLNIATKSTTGKREEYLGN